MPEIMPHHSPKELSVGFDLIWNRLKQLGEQRLLTGRGAEFTASASTVRKEGHYGEKVVIIKSNRQEYARILPCCWGYTTNCKRTFIGGYSQALDSWACESKNSVTKAIEPQPIEKCNDSDAQKVVLQFIEFGKQLKPQKHGGTWTGDDEADRFLRENPFAFLMAACIDRGAKAETVWKIPYLLYQKLGHLAAKKIADSNVEQIEQVIYSLPKRPRFPGQAAKTISELAKMVVNKFGGNPEAVWRYRAPNEIVKYLRTVKGVGPGISSMIVRILVDEFDYDPGPNGYRQIDIKPDVHVTRVFYRTGLVDQRNDKLCVQAARRLNPDYPGLLDWPAWEIGRKWCHESNPNCTTCPLNNVCRHKRD